MSQAAMSMPEGEFSLRITSGNDQGSVYQLVSNKISIGRAPDNDISFPDDPKVSRKHIVISIEGGDPRVTDISGKNFMLVDGEKCKEAKLFDGSRVQIGGTEFIFQSGEAENAVPAKPQPQAEASPQQQAETLRLSRKELAQHQEAMRAAMQASPQPAAPAAAPAAAAPGGLEDYSKPPKKKGNRLRFYSIIAIIGLLFFWLFSTSPQITDDKLRIRSAEDIMKDQEASKEREKAINMKRMQLGKDTRQYDEAQASYIRCFRDYQQSQFTRAIQHCQAALSIFPNHELAERYLLHAQRRRDEKMQFLTRKGKLYLKRGHYTRCMATLTQVMYDLKSPNHPLFKEARQMHAECKAQQEGRY